MPGLVPRSGAEAAVCRTEAGADRKDASGMGRFGAAAGWHVAPAALLSPCHICACWCMLVPETLAMKWVRVLLEGTLTVLWVLFGGT